MNKRLIHILVVVAGISVVANFQHPVTPIYLDDIGLDKALYGFLFAFMALGLSVAAPTTGKWVDRYGTKWFLPLGLFGYAIAQALFGTFHTVVPMILARFLAGLSVSMIFPLLISYVSKISTKEYRVRALSYYTATSLLFISIGYWFGGWLNNYVEARQFFYIQAIALAAFGVYAIIWIPNVHIKIEKHLEFHIKHLPKSALVLMVLYFLMTGVTQTVTRFLDVYIIDQGYTAEDLGFFVMVTGVLGIFANFIVLPWINKRLKEEKLLMFLFVISGLGLFLGFHVFDAMWMGLYTFFLIYIIAKSMYDPVHNAIISKYSDVHHGQIIGLSESAKMLGMFFGPILGGLVYSKSPMLLFSSLSGILLVGVILWRYSSGKTTRT